MTFLLDTHVLLWALLKHENLTKKVQTALTDRSNRIFVSNISLWEISLKYASKKLMLENLTPDDFPDQILESGFEFLEDRSEVFSSFYKLPFHKHFDPFDRLLVWQAISYNLKLITKDKHFQSYSKSGLEIFW